MKAVISGASRRHLRALGHHLQPVIHIGKEGVSPALVAAVDSALGTHELIKVKISENAEGDRHELSTSLAESTASELVAELGRTLLLYRRHPSKPKIALPNAKTKRAAATAARAKTKATATNAKNTRPEPESVGDADDAETAAELDDADGTGDFDEGEN